MAASETRIDFFREILLKFLSGQDLFTGLTGLCGSLLLKNWHSGRKTEGMIYIYP